MTGTLKQTTSRLAIAAAAGLFTGGLALTPVQAADLGGDCCADLEERVAELEATTVRKGNRRVSLKLSGQVNRAIMFWDDGHDSDTYFVDNSNSNTRFRLTGDAAISAHKTAGFRIEADWFARDNSIEVSNCDYKDTSCDGANFPPLPHAVTTDMRYQEVWIQDDRLGKVSLGQGDMASNNMSHVDLSGTSVALYAGHDTGLAFILREDDGSFSGISLGDVYDDFDGLSRSTRIRYDTPSIGGFILSASVGADDKVDGSIRYAKEWNSVRCAAAFAVAHDTENEAITTEDFNEGDDLWYTGGTASCIHTPSGLNLTGGYVERDNGSIEGLDGFAIGDSTWWFAKAGISRRWHAHGKTSIAIQYAKNEDMLVTGDETTHWGVVAVQNIDAAAMELYAAWSHMEYDDGLGAQFETADGYEDLGFVMLGSRIKF